MARPQTKQTSQEKIIESIEKDHSEYMQGLVNKGVFEAPKEKSQSNKEMFSEFWAQYQFSKKKTNTNLEEIVWSHLVSIGHDKPELFNAGIKHFGIK